MSQQRQTPDFDGIVKQLPQTTGAGGRILFELLWWVTAPMLISLVETVKDKNEKVRRKAVASLGELLFYAAT